MNVDHSKSAPRFIVRPGFWAAVLFVLGLLVYGNSLAGQFVFDDHLWVDGLGETESLAALSTVPSESPLWGRLIPTLSVRWNYQVAGTRPWSYRAVNVAVHLVCAMVLFGVLRRTIHEAASDDAWRQSAAVVGWLAAALWMVHPLQSECVNYVSQRTESLAALFYLLTIYAAIRAGDGGRGERWWAALAVCFCAVSMASKEIAVTLPVIVVCYDALIRRESWRWVWLRRWKLYASLAATWLILAALMQAYPRSVTVGWDRPAAWAGYALDQSWFVVHSLRLFLWPDLLVLDYGFPVNYALADVWPRLLLLLALALATVYASFRHPPLGLAGVWFFATLSPTSSVVPILSEVAAERRMYLPAMALSSLAVVLLFQAIRCMTARSKKGGEASDVDLTGRATGRLIAVVMVFLFVLSLQTALRNRDYRDEVLLWRQSMAFRPDNSRAAYNLAWVLQTRGRTDEAIVAYQRLLNRWPNHPFANNNLGVLHRQRGDVRRAVVCFERALEVAGPPAAPAKANMAWILATSEAEELRDGVRAAQLARELCDAMPENAYYADILAAAYAEQGRFSEAIEQAQRARRLAESAGKQGLVQDINARLDGYRQQVPHRESAAPQPVARAI